jgi:glycogen debranching enzyme
MLLIARTRHLQKTEKDNYPVWIGVLAVSGAHTAALDSAQTSDRLYTPARTKIDLDDSKAVVIFAAGETEEGTCALLQEVKTHYSQYIKQRKERMEKLVNSSYVRANDEEVTKAIGWAKISMDALIMDQRGKGIFAGLPWFDDYWGRDSYISLPGATLVTGDFKDAKEILQSFANWQDRDPRSPTSGRVPNIVTTSSMAYNTADGTPRFIIALNDYVKYSNDTAFGREMYPTVYVATEGTLSHHVDSLYFLTHADAESWMDAVGPAGSWSPRGNRANDLQMLWYKQLQASIALAQFAGDYQSAAHWNSVIRVLADNFNKYFVNADSGFMYDHLLPSGAPEKSVRPNQFFALNLVEDRNVRARIFRNATERLVYEHGVASLWQNDENFHPYHHHEPFYVQDAAYHNGIVWTWLAGSWIDAATAYRQQDLAYTVTQSMTQQMLYRGAVGTLSELIDAAPHPGEADPRLSGAFSQAWSLAEYLRNFYQSYLGVTIDAEIPEIRLRPRLPEAIGDIRFVIPVGSYKVDAEYLFEGARYHIFLSAPAGAPETRLRIEWVLPDSSSTIVSPMLSAGEHIVLTLDGDKITENSDRNSSSTLDATLRPAPEPLALLNGIKLAVPYVDSTLKSLKGPDHRILTHDEVMAPLTNASVVYDVADPIGDDKGVSGTYTYPTTPSLKPGCLDITHFSVARDGKSVRFQLTFADLTNPGWHPEYGFQLTYAAIAIDKHGVAGSGATDIGMNSNYTLPAKDAFEDIIYVGGGIRVADNTGKVLAEYLPASGDEKNPMGDVTKKTVTFDIPIDVIGEPSSSWKYAVLIGAQDDHGGVGVGEFRSVGKTAQEWLGGGKQNPKESNVYDLILPKQ